MGYISLLIRFILLRIVASPEEDIMRTITQPEGYNFTRVAQVAEYIVYSYTDGIGKLAYTYWYGDRDDQYVSNIYSLEEAEASICMDQYKSLAFHTALIQPGHEEMVCIILTRRYALPIVCKWLETYDGYLEQFTSDDSNLEFEVYKALTSYFRKKELRAD